MGLQKTFILVFLFFFYYTKAQSYLFSSFPAEKELSSRQITCFFQDSKGFIWIGTEDGLNLYNANSIKTFKHDVKDSNSLLNNYIQNICEDKKGRIWIGTANGIDCYFPSTGRFIHYTKDDQGRSFGFKCKVFVDRDDHIWAGCDGLFLFNESVQQFSRIHNLYHNKYLGTKPANTISGFYHDSKNRYWISTGDGLFLMNKNSRSFERIDTPPDTEEYRKFGVIFSSVYEDKSGELWVGTWGEGLFKILPHSKKLLSVTPKNVSLIYTSQELNNQRFLWYVDNGLNGMGIPNKIPVKLSHINDDLFSPRKDIVSALFTDKQQQLWIGYATEGIQILSPGNQMIKNYSIRGSGKEISSVSVIREKNNSFYAGGWYDDPLCKLDSQFKVIKWWNNLPGDGNRAAYNISDIYFDRQKNMWVSSFTGLLCINEKTGSIKNYRDVNSANNNRFLKILPEGDSVLWLSGYNNGLTRFSINTKRFEFYPLSKKQPALIWKIVFDKKGFIWCADNEGLLKKFDPAKKNFTEFRFDTLTETSIYYDLTYDSLANSLWVASSSGLLKVNADNHQARIFAEKDGIPTTRVNLVCMDNRNRLWIATARGLSLFDPLKNSFRNFYLNNGLISEKLDYSLSISENGKLFIGNNNSISVMNIASVEDNSTVSPVYITAITQNENRLQPAKKDNSNVIDLPYNRNNLNFEFAIADFINPEDNQLLYKLEGWDKDYIHTKKGSAVYNKLPPGKYVFRVKGINHNGIKNEAGDEIIIIIHPPFWKTVWFIILVAIGLLTLVILVVRYISQRNLKEKLLKLEKEQAVEKERNRISRDVHDDLGSGLTKIAIMSEVVKKQIYEPEKATQQLENISVSSRELVDNLQDIIWVLNPSNDTLENLATYIREYALKFFDSSGIRIQFDYPEWFPEIKLSEETRRNIYLVIKETFNNAVKHAECRKVSLTIEYSSRKVKFTIHDDGKGFNPDTSRQFGNGLVNMRSRMEQVDGEYRIFSEPGKGTTTIIRITI